ncbi:sugar phosphate isomerase/epimerase [Segetibacter sp.]|jgi:sugar phosphate isomerase/epimerase|uniref:sugar phosphate isomerase/epimerase family protein n=1 Tax=Segetibacter sp. TaxID=2231182 RepID=UPI00260E5E02|nr:sugar phosphate isomerase/epimerase [Segetibacter sp.]MCW3081042.1 sugar phosphate isomerase/epimerase [Segetibacter sp.]
MKINPVVTRALAICLALSVSFNALLAQNIGLQLYSLRNEFKKDVPGTLAKIKEWKVTLIEGGGSYGLPMEEYKNLLKKNNLTMASVGAGFEELEKDPQKVVDNAKAFGAKYVMCAWVPHKEGNFTMEEINKAIDVFNSAGKLLADNGIKLCYHPHGYEFRPYENGTMFDYMIKKTDPRYVNYEMDVFWVKHPGQDPVALLKKYPKRFLMLHLKDREHGTKGNQEGRAPDETNVVLGKGDVGIEAVMKQAKKIGVKYYFIEDESPKAVEQIPESLKFLSNIKY